MKKIWNEWIIPILGATAFVVGLFGFSILMCALFMDYDPRTMLDGIVQDLKIIFR